MGIFDDFDLDIQKCNAGTYMSGQVSSECAGNDSMPSMFCSIICFGDKFTNPCASAGNCETA